MRFTWFAWAFIAIQTVMLGLGTFLRVMDLFLLEFVSKAELYGYLAGSVLWISSLSVVLLLASMSVSELDES